MRSKVNEVKVKGQRLKSNECKLGSYPYYYTTTVDSSGLAVFT